MRALALALFCLPLGVGAAMAGPMPVLPDLPPLPTDYENIGGGGVYAGVLAGYSTGEDREDGLEAAIVLGNTVQAADLLLGGEVMASANLHGDGSVEAALRVGVPVSDSVSVFGNLGVGYDFERDGFAVFGVSAEADIGGDWLLRADYRLNLDLSGEAANHRILTGLVKRF